MVLARVKGTVVSTHKTRSMEGLRLLLLEKVDAVTLKGKGDFVVGIDSVGANAGEIVFYVTGSSARMTDTTKGKPSDATIIAIVDAIEKDGELTYDKGRADRGGACEMTSGAGARHGGGHPAQRQGGRRRSGSWWRTATRAARARGEYLVALDMVGADRGQLVLLTQGSSCRWTTRTDDGRWTRWWWPSWTRSTRRLVRTAGVWHAGDLTSDISADRRAGAEEPGPAGAAGKPVRRRRRRRPQRWAPGVFADVDSAVAPRRRRQRELMALPLDTRTRLIEAMRRAVLANNESLSPEAVAETGPGQRPRQAGEERACR